MTAREASPGACAIDSQPAETTQTGRPRGYDASYKFERGKRRIVAGTESPASASSHGA